MSRNFFTIFYFMLKHIQNTLVNYCVVRHHPVIKKVLRETELKIITAYWLPNNVSSGIIVAVEQQNKGLSIDFNFACLDFVI